MFRLPLALLASIASISTAIPQVHSYPIKALESASTLEIRIVDRYRLPVQAVALSGRASIYGPSHSFAREPFASRALNVEATDADGYARLELNDHEVAWFIGSRSGYAPTPYYPLFPGWSYECVLDLGTTAWIRCQDVDGQRILDFDLELYWHPAQRGLPGAGLESANGQRPVLETRCLGIGILNDVPRGVLEVIARTHEGLQGTLVFQVASAFGNETSAGLDPTLILDPSVTREFAVLDAWTGEPIREVELDVDRSGLSVAPSYRVRRPGASVSFEASSRASNIAIYAPGYSPVRIQADMATGLMRPDLPSEIRMTPLVVERVLIHLPGDINTADVYSPRRDTAPSDPNRWMHHGSFAAGDEMELDIHLPTEVTVVAVAVDAHRILGFWTVPLDGLETSYVPSARLDIRYTMDGIPAVGLLVRASMDRESPGGKCLAHMFSTKLLITPSAPNGLARLDGLFPGVYHIEPHMHFTVFQDALVSVELAPGEHVTREVNVRRGAMIRGRLVRQDSGEPVTRGLVQVWSDEAQLYKPDAHVGLDESGRFILSGLPPDCRF